MEAPRTKDGKYELILPETARMNHIFHSRAAVEGKILIEFFSNTKSESDLVEKYELFRKYCYNMKKIPESDNLFSRLNLPVVAPIKPDRIIGQPPRRAYEGDSFKGEYELLTESAFNIDSTQGIQWVVLQDLSKYVPELDKYEALIRKGFFNDAVYREITDSNIRDIKKTISKLELLSKFYILKSLAEAKRFADSPLKLEYLSDNFRNDGAHHCGKDVEEGKVDFDFCMASPSLVDKVTKSCIALLEEYISETNSVRHG